MVLKTIALKKCTLINNTLMNSVTRTTIDIDDTR